MVAPVSRRALLRTLVSPRSPAAGDGDEVRLVARIGASCVEPMGVSCRRCGEACDTDAIGFRPIGGGRSAALLTADRCTGCGACAGVCPVGAITLTDADRAAVIQGLASMGGRA
jgi:ferredoxin-type protein NapF